MTVLLLSGAIATGKSATAAALAFRLAGDLVKVRAALGEVLGIDARDRQTLQRRGADLDKRTAGRWLRDYLEEHRDPARPMLVDAVRTRIQTLPILDHFPDSRLVFLEAHEETRRARYALGAVSDPVKASVDFETAMYHPTETEVQALRPLAQVVIATDELNPNDVVIEALRCLGLE